MWPHTYLPFFNHFSAVKKIKSKNSTIYQSSLPVRWLRSELTPRHNTMDFLGFEPLAKKASPEKSSSIPSSTSNKDHLVLLAPSPLDDGVINVRQSGKIRNYVRYATKHLNTSKTIPIVLFGVDKCISMTITIAEILKRNFIHVDTGICILYQQNEIGSAVTSPKDGSDDSKGSTDSTPCITIRLGWTKEVVVRGGAGADVPFASSVPGFQPPSDSSAGCTFLV